MNNQTKTVHFKYPYKFSPLAIVVLLIFSPATASDFQSARTASLGGAGHAAPLLNDSVFQNPSTMSFLPSYSVAYNYFLVKDAQPPALGEKAHGYSVSLQDGRSEAFQGAAAYTHREDGKFVHLAISKRILQNLAAGIGGKLFFGSATLPTGKDASAAVTWAPFPEFQVAAIGDNLLETKETKTRGDYRQYTLGTKIGLRSILFLYVDPHFSPKRVGGSRYGYDAGAELAAFQDFLFRGGAFRSSDNASSLKRGRGWGAGASWIGPRITLDYALERQIIPHEQTAHVMGATIYF